MPVETSAVNITETMLDTEIIDDPAVFAGLKTEWNELLWESSSNNLFLSWEWLYSWWQYLADKRQLYLITVRENQRLLAIAPLCLAPPRLQRLMPFGNIEFLGVGSVGSDYLNFIIRRGYEAMVCGSILACFDELPYPVELVRTQMQSPVMRALCQELSRRHWQFETLTTNRCPYISLAGLDWQTYLQSLPAKHRRHFSSKIRKINKEHCSQLRQVSSEQELGRILSWFAEMHASRWSGKGGSMTFSNQAMANFQHSFAQRALQNGWLRLYILEVDDCAAAGVFMFSYNKVFYYYQAAFDDRFSEYSVGMLALGMAIEQAIVEGADEFDLLHDDDNYKYLWTRQCRELVRLDVYPPHLRGLLQRQLRQTKSLVKSLSNKIVDYSQSGR